MSRNRPLLSALSLRRGHMRCGAAVAILGCAIAFGLPSSPALADIVTATIPVGSDAIGIAVDPAYDTIYVTNMDSGTLSVISGATDTVTDTVPVGQDPFGVGFDPVNDSVYVANLADNTVSVIDAASVPGTFTYSPAAGTVLTVGIHTMTATFTPADTTDYTSGGTVSTQIDVVVPCLTCK
jgi:YVTN family beta-propeller protein